MRHWVMSDWHLGHTAKMVEYCNRPWDYNQKILKSMVNIDSEDCLIFLGDICIGNEANWHSILSTRFKKILVRGNHDHKSYSWYMCHGWDMVVDSFTLNMYAKKMIFTHRPLVVVPEHHLNIHGHCHNDDRYVVHPDKILIKCEHDYMVSMMLLICSLTSSGGFILLSDISFLFAWFIFFIYSSTILPS